MYYLFYKKKLSEYQRYQKESPDKVPLEKEPDTPRRAGGNLLSGFLGIGKKLEKEQEVEHKPPAQNVDEVSIRMSVFDELYVMLLQIDLRPELTLRILSDIARK